MSLLIDKQQLCLYSEPEMSEAEHKKMADKAIDFVQEIANKSSLVVDQKIVQVWDTEYRLWIKSSTGICKIKAQGQSGEISTLFINQDSYRLNSEGIARIKKWFSGEEGPILPLKGNESESVSWERIKPLKNSFWDSWKEISSLKKLYEQEIYPHVKQYMHLLMEKDDSILEVCGGDGKLASEILDELGHKVTEYYLVDRNDESLKKAKSALQPFITNRKVKLVSCDLEKETLHEIRTTFNFVLGIGALTTGVLKKEAARDVFRELASMTKPSGYIILAGANKQWVDSEIIKAEGFSIKNMSLPNSEQQFYVAQKLQVSKL